MHHLLLPPLRQTDNIHGRQLRIGIISRRHLDDIRADQIQTVQAADDGAEFARRPSACFGGAGAGSDFFLR